mgnify:CR=1 FL=1
MQRDPVLSDNDFERCCGVMDQVMKPGEDISWLFCGAHDETEPWVKTGIGAFGWLYKLFFLETRERCSVALCLA